MKWMERGVRPTEPGWYWHQFRDEQPYVTEVERIGNHLSYDRVRYLPDFILRRFAGPIPPPED